MMTERKTMARARISAARRFERALDARHELAREGLVGGKGGGIWDGRGGGGGYWQQKTNVLW